MNLPSALSPQPSVSAPLPQPQPLHDFALHGFAKDRYTIQCSPIAGCWCMVSLNMRRPRAVPLRRGRLRRLCVAVFNIKASYAKRKRWKNSRPSVPTRDLYVLRSASKSRHTSQGQLPSPSSREVQIVRRNTVAHV